MATSKKITAVQFPNGETYPADRGLWADNIAAGDCVALYGKEGLAALHEYRRAKLEKIVPVKSTLRVVCTHRSSSGMSARFRVFAPIILDNGRPHIVEITRSVAEVAGFTLGKNGEIVMGGCGYSKPFQIGYSLGCALWPNGTPEPHGMRNGVPDSSGGYAIGVN